MPCMPLRRDGLGKKKERGERGLSPPVLPVGMASLPSPIFSSSSLLNHFGPSKHHSWRLNGDLADELGREIPSLASRSFSCSKVRSGFRCKVSWGVQL